MSRIIAARRSAIAPWGGEFAAMEIHDLAAPVIVKALADAGLAPDQVGELVVSNALGAGGNPARRVALASGLPERIAGLTIDRQCAGGLDAIILADTMIRAGLHDVIIAGGVESYSLRPVRMRRFGDGREPEPYEQAPFTPWPGRDPRMAEAADRLARDLGIDKDRQDNWAIKSHRKARLCPPALLTREIAPVGGLSHDVFTRDLSARHCRMAPRVEGCITAANMAVAADGAAFVVMVSDRVPNIPAGLRMIAGTTRGGAPDLPGLAPVAAIDAVLSGRAPTTLRSAEIMEAFAVQAIACCEGAGLPPGIVNRHGGALARGHPIGASGSVLAVRLFHQLMNDEGGLGLAAIASAGGLGSAAVFESTGPAAS